MFDWDNKTAIERVLFFDNFYQNVDVDVVDADNLVSFLENIFKTSSDIFLKERALYYLSGLILTKYTTNPYKAIALLLDVKPTNEEFLIVQTIKFLFLFHSMGQYAQIRASIESYQNHQSAEVTSEANFRLGLMELESINPTLSSIDLLQTLNNAEKFFKAATIEIENRADADFFLHFIDLQSAIYKNDYKAFEIAYNEMLNIVAKKQLYSLDAGDIEIEFSIYKLIEQLKKSYEVAYRSNIWHYPITELATLSDSFLQLEKCTMINSFYQDFHSHIKSGIAQNCLNVVYQSRLRDKTELLESIDTSSEICISDDFITYVLNLLRNENVPISNDTQFALALREIITNPQDVEEVLTKLGDNRDMSTVIVLSDYLKRNQAGTALFATGCITGDEVLNSLKKQITTLLPDLDVEKQKIFFDVLAYVIRYAYHSHWGYDKSKHLFLFSKVAGGFGSDAEESHLQDSLFESLKHTSMAQYFEYEKSKVASGGRVDIIFQCDKMRIPIEVKKTDESPTTSQIEEYYIAQVQTYTSACEQLGIFMLLDLSDKGKNPILNFKDWFTIHHLQPATDLPVNHPDYIISVVIPGNKLLPSMMSTYK
ncbi:hypothetical protein LJC11_04690 [Bacteroidales bacterium OttesenSCG-928-I21]|nr:hypothetical protein [Bacteroidales bacterium OttesenSCG-928-I21]